MANGFIFKMTAPFNLSSALSDDAFSWDAGVIRGCAFFMFYLGSVGNSAKLLMPSLFEQCVSVCVFISVQ